MATLAERVGLGVLRMHGFTSREVPTSVGRAHVMEARGDGSLPPVVLLHGFAASGVQLLGLLRRLKPHVRRMWVPDLPAHGFSEVPARGLDGTTLRTGLFEILDAVVSEPVALFGNSMGGLAAIRYALHRADRVSHLVLCSPGGAAMAEHEIDDLRRTFDVNRHDEALEFVDRLLGRRSPLRHAMARSVRRRLSRPELRALMQSVTPADMLLPEHLEALTMPILMVWGQSDRILPDAHRTFFRTHLPGHAEIVEPVGCGHSPYLERPGVLTKHIVTFLGASGAVVDAARAGAS